MKKTILLFLLFLVSIPSFATNSEIKRKADVCKKIKEDGKFYQLTISDRMDCEFYISQDILESYSGKKKVVEKKKQKYQLTAPDGRIVVVEGTKPPTEEDKKAIFAKLPPLEKQDKFDEKAKNLIKLAKKFGLTKEETRLELHIMGYDVGEVFDPDWKKLERCKKMKEIGFLDNLPNLHQERCLNLIKEEKSRKIRDILEGFFGFVLFLLFIWFIIYKAIPKLIYVLRKAWLKASEDAKK